MCDAVRRFRGRRRADARRAGRVTSVTAPRRWCRSRDSLRILVRALFGSHSINALALGGLLLVLAGLATLRVDDHEDRD
jgi:hypothetical protein